MNEPMNQENEPFASDVEEKADWQKPALTRLQAAGAELGDFASPDGNINS